MISALIPIYNQNVELLVQQLHKQLVKSAIPFEILLFDDASLNEYYSINRQLENLSNTYYIHNEENGGIINARNELCKKSKYPWILFLDSDVGIKTDHFIDSYLSRMSQGYSAIFGGNSYDYKEPKEKYHLRYWYGKSKEEQPATIRNKKPYKYVISGNFMIRRDVYADLLTSMGGLGYGSDCILGILMKSKGINIIHIDNPVDHLGLDTNSEYLDKMEKAARTLADFASKNDTADNENDLLKFYLKLKSLGLDKLCARLFISSQAFIKKRLFSARPYIPLLQFYRLGYLCQYHNMQSSRR